jgi:hypothetical protein
MSTNKQQRESASPKPAVPIRLGRVTITGDKLELDEGFAETVARAASTRKFAEHVLANLTMLDDLARAQQRVGHYLNACLEAGDVAGVERWASCGMALDHLGMMVGDDLEKHWPPNMREELAPAGAMSDEEREAEIAAARELEEERARMRGGSAPTIEQIASTFVAGDEVEGGVG